MNGNRPEENHQKKEIGVILKTDGRLFVFLFEKPIDFLCKKWYNWYGKCECRLRRDSNFCISVELMLRERTMKSCEVTIKNSVGLHARAATYFIRTANTYQSTLWVEREDRRVNA